MARRSFYQAPQHNKESRAAERIGKILTEDMGIDLDRVGYYLSRNLPLIVFKRFEVVALSAMEENDLVMHQLTGGKIIGKLR